MNKQFLAKQLALFIIIFGVVLGETSSVQARILMTPQPTIGFITFIEDLMQQLQDFFENIQDYTSEKLSEVFGEFRSDIESALEAVKGDLNLSDPVSVYAEVVENLSAGDRIPAWETSYSGPQAIADELQRQLTYSNVQSILGEDGQTRTLSEIDATTESVTQTGELAQDALELGEGANDLDSSQKVLKVVAAQLGKVASQNAQISEIMGQQQLGLLQARQDSAFTNLNLANINGEIAEQNQIRRQDKLAQLGYELRIITSGGTLICTAQEPDDCE